MKKMIFSAVIFLLFSITTASGVLGQSRDQAVERRGWGYFFVGGGGTSEGGTPFIHVGGGGEGLLYKGFGVGGEIGTITPVSNSRETLGLASVNLTGHFNRSGKVQPFVTGGASLLFREGAAGGGNFGGGVQWWVKSRLGLRFEFRDHIFSSDSPHLYVFRTGVSFR
jgi:hypothetical protein